MNKKTSRNDICPCGSGKKYKNCCLNGDKSLISIRTGLAIAIFVIIIGLFGYFFVKNADTERIRPENITRTEKIVNIPPTILIDNSQIGSYDMATLNLVCAKGLRGAEKLDIKGCLKIIEKWAEIVRSETDRNIYKFYKNPDQFKDSEPFYRMLMLVTVLEQDFGIRYNPDLMSEPTLADLKNTSFFRNSEDLFLHGLIAKRLGTCASIPVLVVSVGRCLGYPLKLVRGKAHLFARWDDGKKRFNIESGGRGMNSFPDERYRKWPFPISDSEVRAGFYMKSMTPVEEYAGYLETRGLCLMENGRFAEALKVFKHASYLEPKHPYIKAYIMNLRVWSSRPLTIPDGMQSTSRIHTQFFSPSFVKNP